MTNLTEHEPINLKELNLSPTEINVIKRCAKHVSLYPSKATVTEHDKPYANMRTITRLIKRGIMTYRNTDSGGRYHYIFTPYGIRVATALGLVKAAKLD